MALLKDFLNIFKKTDQKKTLAVPRPGLLCAVVIVILAFSAMRTSTPYVEEQTEVTQPVNFVKPHINQLTMVIPRVDWKVWSWAMPILRLMYTYMTSYEKHTVVFKDARKAEHLKYEVNGFTLEKLESNVTDWHSEEGQKQYEQEVFALIRRLHPEAKHLHAVDYLFRGGDHPDANPAAVGSPHLDFHQNWDEYLEWGAWNESEHFIDVPEGLTKRFVLGIWKPIEMKNPVSDFCLAVGDASQFTEKDTCMNRIEMGHMNNGEWQEFKAFTSAIKHNPEIDYYYYPFQTNDEVLVFRQLTFDRYFANPHVAFKNDNAPPEYTDTRKSIETRVFVYF
jgi:hypothetical protein